MTKFLTIPVESAKRMFSGRKYHRTLTKEEKQERLKADLRLAGVQVPIYTGVTFPYAQWNPWGTR